MKFGYYYLLNKGEMMERTESFESQILVQLHIRVWSKGEHA